MKVLLVQIVRSLDSPVSQTTGTVPWSNDLPTNFPSCTLQQILSSKCQILNQSLFSHPTTCMPCINMYVCIFRNVELSVQWESTLWSYWCGWPFSWYWLGNTWTILARREIKSYFWPIPGKEYDKKNSTGFWVPFDCNCNGNCNGNMLFQNFMEMQLQQQRQHARSLCKCNCNCLCNCNCNCNTFKRRP